MILAAFLLLAQCEPPDFLVFQFDDAGRDDVAELMAAGKMPNLSALAASGLTFNVCLGAPICSPARRGLQHLEWYTRQSAEAPGEEPPLSSVSLAERLAGYSTTLVGKYHLAHESLMGCEPLLQGWGDFRAGISKLPDPSYGGWNGYEDCSAIFELQYLAGYQRDSFAAWWPLTSSPKLALYATCLPHIDGAGNYHRPPPSWLPPGWPPTPSDRLKFEAMTVAGDMQLGLALAHVDPKRTVVWVIGDNGTPGTLMPDVTGDGIPDPDRGKGSIYERGLLIPCVVAGPGVAQGSSSALCSIVDVGATIVDLATGTPPPGDGRSLRAVLSSPSAPSPRTYVIAGIEGDPSWTDKVTVRHKRFKWHIVAGVESLFDLATDPLELVDVIGDPSYALALQGCRNFYAANGP